MKLFVGGLSFNTDQDGLRRGFESFGDIVEAVVIADRETGRSRGFGFVTFSNATEGRAAVQGMDGKELDGRSVSVNEAQERAPRNGGGGGAPRQDFGGGGSSKGKSRRNDRSDRW